MSTQQVKQQLARSGKGVCARRSRSWRTAARTALRSAALFLAAGAISMAQPAAADSLCSNPSVNEKLKEAYTRELFTLAHPGASALNPKGLGTADQSAFRILMELELDPSKKPKTQAERENLEQRLRRTQNPEIIGEVSGHTTISKNSKVFVCRATLQVDFGSHQENRVVNYTVFVDDAGRTFTLEIF